MSGVVLRSRERRGSSPARSISFALLCFAAGCANAPPVAVGNGQSPRLEPGEGFVVVSIDTDLAIESLNLGRRSMATDLQPGRHIWIVRMREGRYHWTTVKLLAQSASEGPIRPQALSVHNEKEFEFEVVSGAINYPGEIMIRLRWPGFGIESGVSVRNRNHSAMAVRRLSQRYAELISRHPLRYAGMSGDEFLQFYTKHRDRIGATERNAERTAEEAN